MSFDEARSVFHMASWLLNQIYCRYAREDTHYLLYVADKMKQMLVSTGFAVDDENPLIEVGCKYDSNVE